MKKLTTHRTLWSVLATLMLMCVLPSDLRGQGIDPGFKQKITFKTKKAIGEEIKIRLNLTTPEDEQPDIKLTGVKEQYTKGNQSYTLTAQEVTVEGSFDDFTSLISGITDIDLKGASGLVGLSLMGNDLTSIDLSPLTNVESLVLSMNHIKTLDVSKLTKLIYSNCDRNELTDSSS